MSFPSGPSTPPPSGTQPYPAPSPSHDPCPIPFELNTDPGKIGGVYAVIQGYFGDPAVLCIWNSTTNEWMTSTDFAVLGDYTQGSVGLTEDTNLSGNFYGEASGFYAGDWQYTFGGEVFIEYWEQTGGSPDRTNDIKLGVQSGYWDDTECRWHNSKEDYDEWKATHVVQTGDNSNDGLADGNCCEDISEIKKLVRVIYEKMHQSPIFKRGK